MKFKCSCDEARAARVRQRLLRAGLPYCCYGGLLRRAVFEFDDEADMMRAVVAAEGDLAMVGADAPPRGTGPLTLGLGKATRMPPPPRRPAAVRPGESAPPAPLRQAKAL
ncbi:MAG: hypothetical protein ACK4NA_05155 [Alphaproteobacteria bacterium]